MPQDELPVYDEHHMAKHRLLEEYMKVWLPKLGQTYPQVAIIDGFASAGRYQDGRRGSPLIFLDAFLDHVARPRLNAPPHFIFIESNPKFARHLSWELSQYPDHGGARVEVIHGDYVEAFLPAVDWLRAQYPANALPTFAFVDPLGYNAPFELLSRYRAVLGTKAEALVYVPMDFMARFVGTSLTESALDRSFGSRAAWERVRDEGTPGADASRRLAEAYSEVLRTEFDLVSRFAVDPASRNRYYLFFGTDHIDGLRAMKTAYWKVDPEDGRGYTQDILAAGGQAGLFDAAIEVPKAPDEDLSALMRAHFATDEFSIEEAELFALTDTGFRDAHVRSRVLGPALKAGLLEVTHEVSRRSGAFPAGTRMRFTG